MCSSTLVVGVVVVVVVEEEVVVVLVVLTAIVEEIPVAVLVLPDYQNIDDPYYHNSLHQHL